MTRPTYSNDRTWGPKGIISCSLVDKYIIDVLVPDIFCILAVWNYKHLEVWTTIHISPIEYYSSFSVDESSSVVLLSLLALLCLLSSCCSSSPDTVVLFFPEWFIVLVSYVCSFFHSSSVWYCVIMCFSLPSFVLFFFNLWCPIGFTL